MEGDEDEKALAEAGSVAGDSDAPDASAYETSPETEGFEHGSGLAVEDAAAGLDDAEAELDDADAEPDDVSADLDDAPLDP